MNYLYILIIDFNAISFEKNRVGVYSFILSTQQVKKKKL